MSKGRARKTKPNQPRRIGRAMTYSLVGFLCGYLAASILTFTQARLWLTNTLLPGNNQQAIKQDVHQPQLPKPKLEFYTLLAKEHEARSVNVSKTPPTRPANASSQSVPIHSATPIAPHNTRQLSKNIDNQPLFFVQIASFIHKQDAQRMKASLILQDFKAVLTSIKRDNTTWYRVMIGPYQSRVQAEKAQITVAKTEHVMGIIHKMDA